MNNKVYYGLPKKILFCKKTLMSNQKPNSAVEFTTIKIPKDTPNLIKEVSVSLALFKVKEKLIIISEKKNF